MKISVDDNELFTLSEIQKKVIQNDIHSDIFDDDMKRRLNYIIMHKHDQCFKRLKLEWEPRLKNLGIKSVPTDDTELAELIFAQPEYKNRKQREIESRLSENLDVIRADAVVQ